MFLQIVSSFRSISKEAIEALQVYRDIRSLECQTDDCYQVEVKNIRKLLKSEAGLNISNGMTYNLRFVFKTPKHA